MSFIPNLQAIAAKFSAFNIGLFVSLGIAPVTMPTTAFALDKETSQPKSPLSDGMYLYGQSPEPEQLGQEYVVFQVQQNKVVGAVYMPQSEFSCFSGTIDARQMNLSIRDPYDNSVYDYAIALQDSAPVASEGQLPRAVGLEGYHQIYKLSDNDRSILNRCLRQ
jgi:hypothetical protein